MGWTNSKPWVWAWVVARLVSLPVLQHPCHQGQARCRECWSHRGVGDRATSVQPLDINMFPGGSPDQGCPRGLWWRHGPWTHTWPHWQHRLGLHHGCICQLWLLRTCCFPPHTHTHPQVFGSTSLHNAQTIPLLFLSHLSTTYLHMVWFPCEQPLHGRLLGVSLPAHAT